MKSLLRIKYAELREIEMAMSDVARGTSSYAKYQEKKTRLLAEIEQIEGKRAFIIADEASEVTPAMFDTLKTTSAA